MNRSGAGKEGEDRAAAFLAQAGMRIIARNFRSPTGEIDIIAEDGETLVFIEVKSWSSYGFEDLEKSITGKKRERIIETAKYFLYMNRKYNDMKIRFDVIFLGNQGTKYLESAFTE